MVIALGVLGCQEAPPGVRSLESPDLRSQGPTTAPLVDIMQDLATDMAVAAGGIWVEDAEQVAVAARLIADHPKVSPEDRATIQSVLGEEFGHEALGLSRAEAGGPTSSSTSTCRLAKRSTS